MALLDTKRVLVVDDDADVRLWLRTTLEFHNWDVTDAPSGADGLEQAAADAFDVIVLDQMMPGMTGLETAAKLRRDYGGPLVLFSAYLTSELTNEAHRLEVTPVSKLDQQALLRLLESYAAAKRGAV